MKNSSVRVSQDTLVSLHVLQELWGLTKHPLDATVQRLVAEFWSARQASVERIRQEALRRAAEFLPSEKP